MRLKIQPVRQLRKGKVKVWVECDADKAQAYEIQDRKGRRLRREHSAAEAQRIVDLFSKPKSAPARDRRDLVGKRWSDVKDRI